MLILGLLEVPWWGILAIVIILWLMYTARDFGFFRKQGIPGPQPVPVLGTTYMEFFEPPLALRDVDFVIKNKERGYHAEFLGSQPALVVYNADMLQEIMVKKFAMFANRVALKTGDPIVDNSLLALEDAHWKHVRSEMTPTFTSGKLKKMNGEINRCAHALVDSLAEQSKTGEEVDIVEYCGAFAMDVIASTAFGIQINSQSDRNNEFVYHGKNAFTVKATDPKLILILFFPKLAMLLKKIGVPMDVIKYEHQNFFHGITNQAMEMRKENKDQKRTDFLGLMLKAQAGENISDEGDGKPTEDKSSGITTDEIMSNALLFFVAGFDTTASSLSYFMYNMARYPDIQERLVDEIESVVGDKDIIDTVLTQEMPYLDQCVTENLRLYPSLVRVNRVAKEDVTINNVFIKKGTAIVIPLYGLHRDPSKWPEPDKFDPERFSPENKRDRHPYYYIPFGNGPRVCIGMRLALQEIKVAIIQVLRKVKVSTCSKTEIPVQYIKSNAFIKPKKAITLKVEPRSQ